MLCRSQSQRNWPRQTTRTLIPIRFWVQTIVLGSLPLAGAGHTRDRYLRFGYAAQDKQIERYVEGLNFDRDDIFGIYNRKLELIAMAHLAYANDQRFDSCAEFGVSVLYPRRAWKGYGARLFERAAGARV